MSRPGAWVANHLPWIVVALLVLWVPPVLFNAAVNLHLVAAPSGYPGWRDPAFVLPAIELTSMIAAVPALLRGDASGWVLLVWSRLAVAAQTAWALLVNVRLQGLEPALTSKPIAEALVGLAVAAVVLQQVRRYYGR